MTASERFDPRDKRRVALDGGAMAYLEHGVGAPIVMAHGNPTSSFLWRKVFPALSDSYRCVAPDLIGMGDSDKVESGPDAYRFATHSRFLEDFMEAVSIGGDVTLVGHDWGGPLLADWGRRHPERVKGVVLMETLVTPISWSDWPERSREIFEAMRSEAGEVIILEKNVFVERLLPAAVLEPLPEDVMDEYRRPFAEPGEDRRPTLTWPRELPIDGHPPDVVAVIRDAEAWLSRADVPKLFVNAEPGFLLTGRIREVVRSWPNLEEVTVPGSHFIQEDSGAEIGRLMAAWLAAL